ncbi:hypothetical protein NYE67_10930 [Solibacillus sp. FSL W8-0474]|uniref:hypothetical protein n=1 Tax=Solibacillus sp. FSL W8-0474 TaxID=2975336 RepID=UPI0030FB45A2
MIFVLENKDSLSIVDWAQIASAIGTVLAAIFALITTLQNRKANKLLNDERHLMVKPSFRINSTFEKGDAKQVDLGVINLGFNRVMNNIEGTWEGNAGVKISVIEVIDERTKDNKLTVIIDYSACNIESDITGSLSLSYANVYGKLYMESVEVEIKRTYYEHYEGYYFDLKEGLVGQAFIDNSSKK